MSVHAEHTSKSAPQAYNQSLGNISVSAVALSLHQLLEIYAIITKLEQETYNLQQNTLQFMAQTATKNAKTTYDALCASASSMRYNAIGSLTNSAVTVGGELKGLHSFSKATEKLNPIDDKMAVMSENKKIFTEELHPVSKQVNNAGEIETRSTAPVSGEDYAKKKADVEAQIARYQKVEAKDIRDLANAKREEALSIKKKLDNQYSDESDKKRSIQTERDNDVMKWRGIGQGFGGLVNGALQTRGAQFKTEEAEAEALKADAQTAQTISQGIVERQGQGIGSFDSARQAIAQAQSEMSASNRV